MPELVDLYFDVLRTAIFIYLKFSKHVKNSEHKIVGLKINIHAAWL